MTNFVHLQVHSEYSIKDSIIPIAELCDRAKKEQMKALAITDICNLFGMVKFYKTAIKQGIKPIVGSELYLENNQKLILLCQNNAGYHNLSRLITKAYQEGDRLIKDDWLREYQDGLIAIGNPAFAQSGMELFQDRFYLNIQRLNRSHEKAIESEIFAVAKSLRCPIVATNEVVFLERADFSAHKARVCIQEGTTLEQAAKDDRYSVYQYFRTADEMQRLFQDIPQVLENSVEIAKRCTLNLTLDQPVLPNFPVPQGMTEDSFLKKAAMDGLSQRQLLQPLYEERLQTELSVIEKMGFSGYFLIVWDFIQWAKQNAIPVGPGRGSGAGSLVAYVLSITDLDPIQYDLLFERFLNPERVSMPDFDIDFCMDNRDKVIEYVIERYGRENVSQIATFGTMAAKAVIRDVGRVLGHPYGFVDKIAKLIPFEIGITLEKALEQEPLLQKRYNEEEEVKNLIDLAKKLEGITRNVGKHAGGVVIAPSALTDFAPLYSEEIDGQKVIQFDKDDVETIGLVKFDFLGLRTLTIIDWAVRQLPHVNIHQLPMDDSKTFDLLKKCHTTAVFQLESRGMKELIKRLQPDHFEEIIALVALFRPGPLQSGMVDDFINRKHGRAKVEYLHPKIEHILKPTYGVILYQEQVMQIAQVLSGYTLGEADLLRRAMGKKKPEEMAKQRNIFTQGAVQNGVEEKTATYIFDLVEKFSGYGFNKSHSAAYALLSYQTAWLKAHYPSQFMAAVLSSDMNHTDKVVNMIEECRRCKIKIISPTIHDSEYYFTVNDKNEIIYGLGAIKGVGEAAIENMIAERKHKPFLNLFDFCERVDNRKVNKRVLDALIKAGAMDCFETPRHILLANLDKAMSHAEQTHKHSALGQASLFEAFPEMDLTNTLTDHDAEQACLKGEKETLGLFLSGHPLQAFAKELKSMQVVKFADIKITKTEQKLRVAGLITAIRSLQTKNGSRMAVLTVDDQASHFEVTVFPEVFQNNREILIKDALVVIDVACSIDKFTQNQRVVAQSFFTLDMAREKFVKRIKISLNPQDANFVQTLKEYLMLQENGSCQIYLQYQTEQGSVELKLSDKWNIKFSPEMLPQIKALLPQHDVILEY